VTLLVLGPSQSDSMSQSCVGYIAAMSGPPIDPVAGYNPLDCHSFCQKVDTPDNRTSRQLQDKIREP
jgi:hypothetical protein